MHVLLFSHRLCLNISILQLYYRIYVVRSPSRVQAHPSGCLQDYWETRGVFGGSILGTAQVLIQAGSL